MNVHKVHIWLFISAGHSLPKEVLLEVPPLEVRLTVWEGHLREASVLLSLSWAAVLPEAAQLLEANNLLAGCSGLQTMLLWSALTATAQPCFPGSDGCEEDIVRKMWAGQHGQAEIEFCCLFLNNPPSSMWVLLLIVPLLCSNHLMREWRPFGVLWAAAAAWWYPEVGEQSISWEGRAVRKGCMFTPHYEETGQMWTVFHYFTAPLNPKYGPFLWSLQCLITRQ